MSLSLLGVGPGSSQAVGAPTANGTPIGLLLSLTRVPSASTAGTPIGLLLALTKAS